MAGLANHMRTHCCMMKMNLVYKENASFDNSTEQSKVQPMAIQGSMPINTCLECGFSTMVRTHLKSHIASCKERRRENLGSSMHAY